MDGDIKTTFFPRRPQLAAAPLATVAHRGADLVSLFATIVFVASVVICGGVYAWQFLLKSQIAGQEQSLARAEAEYDARFVDEASRLNDRIVAAEDILDRHVAPSALLDILEQFTLRTVSFQTFTYSQGADGKITLAASGVGESFGSIVLQSDQFGGPAQMRDVVFSRLEPNDQSLVTFNFSATVDPKNILYFRTLRQGSAFPTAPAAPAATSSASAGTSL